ncbi:MAG: hypothetical protein CMI52_02960 [Parcubacteria group bacterium]|nr:hypothetical protein [Parcubacteria group bacterium]
MVELLKSDAFDFRIIGVDAAAPVQTRRMLDVFFHVPSGNHPSYIQKISEIVKHEGVDVILPSSDDEAFAVSAAMNELEHLGAKAIVSPQNCLERISNKETTYTILKKAGILVPEFRVARNEKELLKIIEFYEYPKISLVLKPTKGSGNRGIHILCGLDNPPSWLGSGRREKRIENKTFPIENTSSFIDGDTLVMPCLQTPAYDVDVLYCAGQEYAVYVRQRMNPTGIPFEGNILCADSHITDYCRKIATTLGLTALHDMDLMTTTDGEVVIMEVNPRASGSLSSTLVSGFSVLDWAVASVLGIKFRAYEPETKTDIIPLSGTFAVPKD